MGWNDEIKAAIRRKKDVREKGCWQLAMRQKKDVWKRIERRREMLKRCTTQSKKKVNEQFGKKMNEDVNGNRKLFWKEVGNAKGGKVESCSRVQDGNRRLA